MTVYLHKPLGSPGANESASAQAKRVFRAGRLYSHLSADSEEELVEFAKTVGLPINWLQSSGKYSFHFDVTGAWLDRLIKHPSVKKITVRAFGRRLMKKSEAWRRSRNP